ncbi:hypothetical protein [Arthrobacter sp. PAO19]|uniref:hypothetical protein n=1 Tax=Glutamicibacter mishrai TaxID=1775880 RepID=UPI0003B57E4D
MNALILASEAAETGLGGHTWSLLIGGSIFVALMILLLITVSYTNVGNRHSVKDEEQDIHRQFKTHEPHSH